MGVEPARVLEVHDGATVGAGYLLDDRLVLTAGAGAGAGSGTGDGPPRVRPGGTATWLGASTVWSSPAGVRLLQLDDPAALFMAPAPPPWGRVTGRRPVAVTAMGFPPALAPARWARDPVRFFGHVAVPGAAGPGLAAPDAAALAVSGGPAGAGMTGAALFAGAELVGVLVAGGARVVPAGVLAAEPGFARLVAGAGNVLALADVASPATAFPML